MIKNGESKVEAIERLKAQVREHKAYIKFEVE